MLSDCTGLKNVGQLVIGDGFNNMKSLAISECNEMEYLVSTLEEKIPTTTFIALEELYLYDLDNLKEILHGPMPAGFLDKLEKVYVEQCQSLVSIFSPDVWVKLKNLHGLCVDRCEELKEVFYLKEEEEGCRFNKLQDGHVDVTFPNLKELYLRRLPELTIIWKGVIPIESLKYLKVIEVKECDGLRYLFSTPTMVLALQQLEKLKIVYCMGMIAIAAPEEEMVQKDQVLIPPHTSNALPPQTFSNLRELVIKGCDSLKDLYPLTKLSHGGLSQLRQLEVWDCENLEEIFLINTDGKAMLPQLEELSLQNLPSLKTIWKGNIPIGSFENLKDLMVKGCDRLKHILPIRLLANGGLPKLKEIHVFECNEMEVIFNEDGGDHDQYNHSKSNMVVAFPHLEVLSLVSLPKLSKFHQGPPILDWPSLEVLEVSRCENLKRLPLNHPHSLFPKLERIWGESERWFDEELEWEDESLKLRLRPLFNPLKKSTLEVSRCCK